MKKFIRKYGLLILLILSLFLYEMTVSNGLYVSDTKLLANAIESGRTKETYLYQSSPLYAELSIFLFNIFDSSSEIVLSQVSIVFVVLSVIPLWFILKKYFDEEMTFYGCLLYIFLPFIWFIAINAKTYAMSLFFSTLFTYFLVSMKKSWSKIIFLSILFGIMSAIHTINIYLLPLFLVYLNKNKQRIVSVVTAAIVFLSIRLLFNVPIFPQYEYTVQNLQIKTMFFSFGMNLWALFNSLGIATFFLSILSIFLFLTKGKDKRLIFWATPSITMFVYGKDSICGITPVMPFIIFLVIEFLMKIKDHYKKLLILSVCLVLQIVKFLPFAFLIHNYPSPHQIYADRILAITQPDDIILGGHEGAWFFNKRTFFTPTDNFTIDNNRSYFITIHYITTENRFELEGLAEQIGFSPFDFEIVKNNSLIQKRCDCQEIKRPHNFEDPYLYFMSVTPSIFYRLVFLGDVSYKTDYWVCKICF